MTDATIIRDAADMIQRHVQGHGNMPENLRQIARDMEEHDAAIKSVTVGESNPNSPWYSDQ